MSSSILQSSSNESPSSDIAVDSSLITPSKRDIFLSTYNRRQRFTLPNSMMHYIAKNPKNSKFYQKMVKSCKYFFIKNPILVLSHLEYNHKGWGTWVSKTWENIDMNKLLCKLWITDELGVYPEDVSNNYIVSLIIPKIYQCYFERLILENQVISYYEFLLLCSSVKILDLERVTVNNFDGTVVSLEKLFEQLPQLKEIYYVFFNSPNNISKNTFKELWKISHLSNYDRFDLYDIPEDFDIESFYSFMKKNKNTRIGLEFSDEISEEYKIRLEAIVDEINATENHEYKVPFIFFSGLDLEKFNQVCDLYLK